MQEGVLPAPCVEAANRTRRQVTRLRRLALPRRSLLETEGTTPAPTLSARAGATLSLPADS